MEKFIGQVLRDRYRIQSVLGGQTGRRTFLANDLQKNLLVVVKLLLFSPDFTWEHLKLFEREAEVLKFLEHLCPDFLVELMSPCYSLSDTREKMKEYLENGMRLGWLINRETQQVEIYRADKEVEILDSPQTLSGEDVLPGFTLDMTTIMDNG